MPLLWGALPQKIPVLCMLTAFLMPLSNNQIALRRHGLRSANKAIFNRIGPDLWPSFLAKMFEKSQISFDRKQCLLRLISAANSI